MPAADDLLVASQAETGRAERFAGRLTEKGDATAGQDEAWLLWVSELLKGTRGLALLRISESGSATVSTQTPAALSIPEAGLALARRAAARGSRQRLILPGSGDVLLSLPLPSPSENERVSSVLLLLNGALNQQQQSSLLGLANWALKSARWWLDATPAPIELFPVQGDTLSEPQGIAQLVNRLETRYPGTVCALHWMRADRRGRRLSRVMAVSGQSTIDRSGAAVRRMAQSADELYADGAALSLYKVRPTSRDARAPVGMNDDELPWAANLWVPVSAGGELLVVSLHWRDETLLPEVERERLLAALPPAVQSAWLQQQNNQSLSLMVWNRWRSWLKIRFQGGLKRWFQAGLLSLVMLALLWPVEKRLSADVIVEAAERHALIAPLDGYVKSVQARAGDRVAKGELLARLDDEDLLRQADKWAAEASKNQQDHLSALAAHDRVELSSLRENRLLIQTELEQVRAQLARHELRAPVAGIVLSDAVEDALGSAVKAGKILFEVGSADQYRLALQVPERRISEVQPGQLLSLRMAADPKQRSQARVDILIPVATASQGQNTFKVYASPVERDAGLRPGMQGIGKILVGRESRLMQWWDSLWTRCVWLAWKLGLVA